MKGIVKWYNARKGYGFITPEDKTDDVFVHAVVLKSCGLNKLFTGSEVSFEIEKDDKGKRAKDLKVLKEVKPDFTKQTDKDKKEAKASPDKKEAKASPDKKEAKASPDKKEAKASPQKKQNVKSDSKKPKTKKKSEKKAK